MISPWGQLAITSLAVFVVSLDTTALFVAFPAIRASYPQVTIEALSWVLNGYTVVYAALLTPLGRWADATGRRRMFVVGAVGFVLSSAACGLAPSAATLIAARAVQGAFGAALVPSSLALVLAAFPPSRRAVAVSVWGAVGALAAAVGPSLGALLVASVGWRWVFLVNVPLGLYAASMARARIAESRDDGARGLPDAASVVLVAAAAATFALAVVQLEEWGPRTSAALLLGAAALAAGFVARARRVPSPAVDLRLFRDRNFTLAGIATFVFGVAFTAMFMGFVFFLTRVWHYSVLEAGLAITPGPLTVIPAAIVGGRIAGRVGHRPLLVAGGLLLVAAGGWLALWLPAEPSFLTQWLPRSLLSGTAVGLVLPSLGGAALHGLAPRDFAVGSAVNQALRQFGSIVGVALSVVLLEALGDAAFPWLFGQLAVAGVVVAALARGIRTAPRRA